MTCDTAAQPPDVLGPMAFHTGMLRAIRALDNEELRALLLALLWEWRIRAAG